MGTLKLLSKTLFLTCSGLLGFYPVTGKWKENKSENVCVSYFIIFNLSSIENNNYWINYFFCQIAWNLSQHITLKKNPKNHSGSIYKQKQILAPSLMVKEAMTEKNTKTTEYKYLKLNELQANTTVHVFGVVKFARPPTKTRGSGKWRFFVDEMFFYVIYM